MNLNDVVEKLDGEFRLSEWDTDPAMRKWVPRTYGAIGYDFNNVFEAPFCETFNGLMLRSADIVEQVYCCSFPTPEILTEIIERCERPSLLFTHHPVDMEVSGRGFLPISSDHIAAMQRKSISAYAIHAPLDTGRELGTNAAILQTLGLRELETFVPYGVGHAGRIAEFSEPRTLEVLSAIRRAFRVHRLELGGNSSDEINRVAVVAGGGDDLDIIREAVDHGCDMYLSGEWYFRQEPRDEDTRKRFATANEETFRFVEESKLLLVGVSHAASEYMVMETQMAGYFQRLGLPVECVPQQNWWR